MSNTRNVSQWGALLVLLLLAVKANGQQTTTGEKTAPTVGIKTNLLYDATTTLNLGAEFRLGGKTSLDIPVSYNPWTFDNNKKWKHILVQPELRYWTKETFQGSFFGLHAHYAFYNVGALDNPPFSEYMNTHRFEGWLLGAGISYGYRWNFNHHWGMEATLGVGYAYLSYDKYPCNHCGVKIASETKNYFGPTKAGISLIYNIGGKKAKKTVVVPQVVPIPEPVVEKPAPKVIYQPQFTVSYITPEVETVKVRAEAGKAYLDFAVGASAIKPEYKNNASELRKIHELIATVKNDSNATITGITINGFASPEGSYTANMNLSGKRAAALKEYIKREYGFAESFFTVSGKGEDWAMLDSLVSQSAMTDRSLVLDIIRGTDIFDGREKKIMNLSAGVTYRSMLADLFPQLRRTEYQLNYTVLPFTVEKGKEVFKTRPSSLSLNEMFLIAQTYPVGSDAYNEVFETAARIFPASDIANLNAAANALARKDTVSAANYLSKVKDQTAAYHNNLGMLQSLQNQWEQAAGSFRRAAGMGNSQAIENMEELDKREK